MRMRRRGVFSLVGVLALAATAPPAATAAERLYGVTTKGELVSFRSDSPGLFRSSTRVTGLAGGDRITAIDLRPATGALYGLGRTGRLYTIVARTGRATPVGGPFRPGVGAQDVGFDFNPVTDGLRLVTGAGRNFRLDPNTGAPVDGDPARPGTQGDGRLAYAPGDPAGSAEPSVATSAYANNVAGAATTTLYGLDTARDTLVLQNPPNEGVLGTVGRLGLEIGGAAGFDIARDGRAYASVGVRSRRATQLYRINLLTGRARRAASQTAVGGFAGTRGARIRALAAGGRAPNDNTRPRLRNRKLNSPRVSQLLTGRVLKLSVRCSEPCVVESQLLLGRQVVGGAIGGVPRGGVRRTLRLRLSRKGRRIVRRRRPLRLDVGIAATDAAGNAVRSNRFQR